MDIGVLNMNDHLFAFRFTAQFLPLRGYFGVVPALLMGRK